MAITYEYDLPALSTTHLVFQPSLGVHGNIITLNNSVVKYLEGFNTYFLYGDSNSPFEQYSINLTTSDYIYFHMVFLSTTALLYGIKANYTVTLLKSFSGTGVTAENKKSITLYGDVKYSYLWTLDYEQNQTEIDATLAYNFKPTWNEHTLALADFNDNSIAAGVTKSLNSWRVYKRKTGDTVDTYVGEVPATQKQIEDFAVSTNTEYQYKVVATSDTITGVPLTSNNVTIDSWSYSLVDTVTKQVFLFELDIESAGTVQEYNRYEYDSMAEKNKVAYGRRRFIRDGMTATFGYISDVDNSFSGTLAQYQALESFFNNHNPKIFRNREGALWVVDVYNLKKKIDDKSVEQVKKVSFDIMEVGSISDYPTFL